MNARPMLVLSPSIRLANDSYPGVVAQLGPNWRIAISTDARRYCLQQRVPVHLGGTVWVSAGRKSPATLAGIAAKYAATVPGLADAVARLPARPADANPEFAAATVELQRIFAERRRLRATPPPGAGL